MRGKPRIRIETEYYKLQSQVQMSFENITFNPKI